MWGGEGELVLQHPSASSKSARWLLTLGWTASSKKLLRKVIILWWWWWGEGGVQINSGRRDRVIGGPSNRVPPNEPRCEGREKVQPSSLRWFIPHSSSPGEWLIAFSHLGTQPSTFNYVPMVGGIEAGRRRRGGLGRGGEGGIKPSWLMAPTSGASPLKLFSCTDDSKQGGGVASGWEVPSSAALSR